MSPRDDKRNDVVVARDGNVGSGRGFPTLHDITVLSLPIKKPLEFELHNDVEQNITEIRRASRNGGPLFVHKRI